MIDEERKLRHEAENNLKKLLVDLYNNPDINKELRSRLPRAKDFDPLVPDSDILLDLEEAERHRNMMSTDR